MKKRFLSILLTVSMLLSVFTVFGAGASAASDSGAPTTPTADGGASYLDLYVKDGLVALFDGYALSASDTVLDAWAPVNLYGADGYENYADPSSYTSKFEFYGASAAQRRVKWTAADGYLSLSSTGLAAATGQTNDTVMNLNALGEKIGYRYSVQEVFLMEGPLNPTGISSGSGSTIHYTPAYSADGLTVENFDTLGGQLSWQLGAYGPYESNLAHFAKEEGHLVLDTYMAMVYVSSTFRGITYFKNEYYGAATVAGLMNSKGASISNYYVGKEQPGVFERTISRYGASLYNSETEEYEFTYSQYYQFAPSGYTSARAAFNQKVTLSHASQGVANSTALKILANEASRVYSVRIYGKTLDQSELNRNHLADLCGLYGSTFVGELLALDASVLSKIIDACAETPLSTGVKGSDTYKNDKAAFEGTVTKILEAYRGAEENSKLTAYDKLYIGADGTKSASGGSLVALYSAYAGNTNAVSLESGLWFDKIAGNHATILGSQYDKDTAFYGWKLRKHGGIGYDMTLEDSGNNKSESMKQQAKINNAILFDPTLIASPDFTVEYVASYENYFLLKDGVIEGEFIDHIIDAEGNKITKKSHWADDPIPTDTVGILKNYATRAGYLEGRYRSVRWCIVPPAYDYSTAGVAFGFNSQMWGDSSRLTTNIYNQTITRDETAVGNAFEATYAVYADGTRKVSGNYSTAAGTEKSAPVYYKDIEGQELRLFNQVPVSVYVVRIYDAALTEAEMKYNRFIDMAAYAGADLSVYETLEKEKQLVIVDMMATSSYSADKESFNRTLKQFEDMLSKQLSLDEVLYATKGLTVLLTAYAGFYTSSNATSESTVVWSNAVDDSTYGILNGTGWKKNAAGGFTIVKTPDDYINTNSKESYGLSFDGALLPEASYTVELVANPVGITKEDGTRYIDSISEYGTWIENGIAIGPLRAMQFGCYRPAGYDGQMERRWNYGVGNSPFIDNGGRGITKDTFWQGLGLEDIVTLNVSLQITESSHVYSFRQDGKSAGFTVAKDDVISNEAANSMFRLMYGVAGTIYSVRVYDHVLSEAEIAQNHMADLIYYYDIDAGPISGIIHAAGSAVVDLAAAFADFDFTMDKAEAQEIFNARITAMWLSHEGFSVKNDYTDGMRYYFRVSESALSAAMKADYEIELGAVVNIGKNADPVLDGYGYDYKVVAFDTTMGKVGSIFTDEDTFAVTVRYGVGERDELVASVDVRGYVKLTDKDGNEFVYYTYTPEKTPASLFEAYRVLDDKGPAAYTANDKLMTFVSAQIEKSYMDLYVYADATAKAGGNGTADAPYGSFEDAFSHCKELLRAASTPTNLYLEMADGKYSVFSTQELLDADKPYLYSNFIVTSKSGNAVLTTTLDVDASKFVLEGDNVYSYQFEKDANGEYPAFRVLYVNDSRASIATSGSTRSANRENLYVTAFDRTYDHIYQSAKSLYGQMDFTFMPENYVGRADLEEAFAYYRDSYVALYDVRAIVKASGTGALSYGMSPSRANASETYNTAFHGFVIRYIAAHDAAAAAGTLGIASESFKSAKPTKTASNFGSVAADYEIYCAAFTEVRDHMVKNQVAEYDGFDVAERTDVRHIGKVYLPLDMVGDLEDLITRGKADMLVYIEEELLLAESGVVNASAAYDKAVADYTDARLALKTLEALDSDFHLTLDDTIAQTKAARDAAAEADKHKLTVILEAYETLKASIGSDPEKARQEQMAILETKIGEMRDVMTEAENAYYESLDTQKTVEERAEEVKDDELWRRHALTMYKIEMHMTCQWSYNVVHLTGVDYADCVESDGEKGVERHVACYIDMDEYSNYAIPGGYSMAQRYVHMENAYIYLDENNEYYYDAPSGKLYLYSDTDVKNFEIGYATLDHMFILKEVENVTFKNVQLTGTDDYYLTRMGYTGGLCGMDNRHLGLYGLEGDFQDRSALYVEDCSDLSVIGCRFYDLPCEGISVRGWLENAIFEGNTFEGIGSAALRVGQHTRSIAYDGSSWKEGVWGSRNVTVVDNYFTDIGYVYKVPVLQFTKLEDGEIRNNTIIGCAYSGISVGWDWGINANYQADVSTNARNVDISYNYITDFMTEMGDGSAIYMPIQNGTVANTDFYLNNVHHNYIVFSKNTGDGMGKMVVGIYFDASTSNWYCCDNVVVEQSYGAHASESDAVDSEEAALKQLRRQGSFYIYLQHIDAQETHNILVENNYILNVRGETDAEMHREVYQNYFSVKDAVKGRNLIERGTVYVKGVGNIPAEAIEIIESAGAKGQRGDVNLVYSNEY